MAGFEIVVRPAVFPDIRPRSTPALPPVDDPTQGFAVIKGNGAGVMTISKSTSISSSHSKPVEIERRVDETRVYQQDDDGTVNRDNFVDLQVANRITMKEGAGPTDKAGGTLVGVIKPHYYLPVKEGPNIEILEHNKIVKADD